MKEVDHDGRVLCRFCRFVEVDVEGRFSCETGDFPGPVNPDVAECGEGELASPEESLDRETL